LQRDPQRGGAADGQSLACGRETGRGHAAAYEGDFFLAARATSTFCRPTCPARKPDPRNVDFFCTTVDALAAGFRPCTHCRPLQLPASPPPSIERLMRQVESDRTGLWTDAKLQREQIDPIMLRRWCKQHFGMSFHALIRGRRLGFALAQLQAGNCRSPGCSTCAAALFAADDAAGTDVGDG
jgi:methylphosphotriester-DNA--protein-cysteine methyltransferase